MERRLAVIFAADVVGYSRLMGEDEAGTLARLEGMRAELLDPLIADNHGRLFKVMGDGFLIEFASVVDALQCATAWQQAVETRAGQISEARAIRFRIGINVGDVIVKGTDVLGDGVNISSRLEKLAEPGEIVVSSMVADHARGKLPLEFKSLGSQKLKNIAEPVDVFRIVAAGDTPLRGEKLASSLSTSRFPLIAAGLGVLVLLAGTALWHFDWLSAKQPDAREAPVLALPSKPSIAVLPFTNFSDDTTQDYFADGMSEDLITDLSKVSGLFVVSRHSSFSYKDKPVEVRRVAQDLGVRYVLEGSVRRAGDTVRINVQLIDATTGGHLWAERYDGKLAEVFDLQDRVTRRIVSALAIKLTPQEAQSVIGAGTNNVEAHEAYLLGLSLYYRRTPESWKKALGHFDQAVALDPGYTQAHAARAKIFAQTDSIRYSRALQINLFDAPAKARTALEKVENQDHPDVHVVRAWLALRKFQQSVAIAEAERSLQLNPNGTDALEALAAAKIYAGESKSGVEIIKTAMRKNPALLDRPLMLLGLAEFAQGNPGAAVEDIERAFEIGSEEEIFAAILAASYAELGNNEKAKEAFSRFRRSLFGQSGELSRSMTNFPFSRREVLERLAAGLEAAGAKVWYEREDGGYLALNAGNRLSGDEINELLSGKTIEGRGIWEPATWFRTQDSDGKVEYSGFRIQAGVEPGAPGTTEVKSDLLCENWQSLPNEPTLCSAIFRLPAGNARTRWGPFVLVTDLGPQPFQVVQ